MKIYDIIKGEFTDSDNDITFDIGRRSLHNIFPDKLIVRLYKTTNVFELKWKSNTFHINVDTILYWHDGFTGCEYNSYDKVMVDTTNQHKLECAYEIIDELTAIIEKRGLFRCAK